MCARACVQTQSDGMAADLTEVGSAALFAELQRRVGCLDKPEKRIILLGACRGARTAPSPPSPRRPRNWEVLCTAIAAA